MSDLFNHQEVSDSKNAFDSCSHARSLCEGGKIKIPSYAKIDYKKGWEKIVEELIKSIKRHPIELSQISADYAQLEIIFCNYEKTQEVRVWRAIDIAQRMSKSTCMQCGENGRRRLHGDNLVVYCRSCINIAERNGETGTWLDKY